MAVNGKVIQTPDKWVDLERDKVTLDGKPVRALSKLYVLLYKPTGYLTTYKDPEGRATVYDLLTEIDQFISPVGRLDQDTSGLLILTNDTQFAERITNPDYKVSKTYLVKATTVITEEQIQLLRDGVILNDGPTKPATVNRVADSESRSSLEITITEGRNRQVRRMIEAIDSKVKKLARIAIGPIRIEKLEIGKHRNLTPREVDLLRANSYIMNCK